LFSIAVEFQEIPFSTNILSRVFCWQENIIYHTAK